LSSDSALLSPWRETATLTPEHDAPLKTIPTSQGRLTSLDRLGESVSTPPARAAAPIACIPPPACFHRCGPRARGRRPDIAGWGEIEDALSAITSFAQVIHQLAAELEQAVHAT
jgi:hypothetical protein